MRILPFLLALACSPDEDDTGAANLTEAGLYTVDARWSPDPPTSGDVQLDLHIADAQTSTGLTGATLTVTPWMPEHGHGISEPPVVTEGSDGDYQVAFAFSMPGYWEVEVEIDGSAGVDRIVLPVDVE